MDKSRLAKLRYFTRYEECFERFLAFERFICHILLGKEKKTKNNIITFAKLFIIFHFAYLKNKD